jgi:hypothetical protein
MLDVVLRSITPPAPADKHVRTCRSWQSGRSVLRTLGLISLRCCLDIRQHGKGCLGSSTFGWPTPGSSLCWRLRSCKGSHTRAKHGAPSPTRTKP